MAEENNKANLEELISRISDSVSVRETTEEQYTGLDKLADAIKMLEAQLANNIGDENTVLLVESYKESNEKLTAAIKAGDEQQVQLETAQLLSMQEVAEKSAEVGQSEEERREANKLSKRMAASMDNIVQGLENFGDKVDEMLGNVGKGMAFGALALMMFDPEKLQAILDTAISFARKTIKAITDIMNGSFEGLYELFASHPWISSFIAGYALLKSIIFLTKGIKSMVEIFGMINAGLGRARAFLGFVWKGVGLLGKGLLSVGRGLMALGPMLMSVGSAILSGMTAAFGAIASALSTVFSAVLVPLAPFIAIGAAIAAIGYSIYEGLSRAFDIFDETGSIMDAIVGGISGILGTLVALPFDILKSIVSTVAGWLGFEEFEAWLDSFSFADMFTEAFDAAFAMIGDMLSGLWDIVTWPFTALNDFIADIFGVNIGEMLSGVLGGIWDAITEPLGAISDFIGQAFDAAVAWVKEKLSWIPGVGGLTDEQSAALDTATESGLYDKDLVGNSEINRDMVAQATMAQLDAIRADADLSEEDMKFIEDEIARRTPEAPTRGTEPTTARPDFAEGATAMTAADFDGVSAQQVFEGAEGLDPTEQQVAVASIANQAVSTPPTEVVEAVQDAQPQVQNAGTVTEFMSSVPLVEDITNIFTNVTDWVVEKTTAVVEWLSEFAFLQPVFTFVESVTGWVGEKVEAVMDFLEEIDIFEALKDGIESLSSFLGDAIDGAINWVQEKLSWIPGIDAPEPRVQYNEGDPERLRQARESAGLAPEGSNTSVEQNQAMTYQALVDQGFEEDEIANIMGMMQGESGFRPAVEGSYRNTSNERIREAMGNRVADLSDDELTALKQDDQAFYDHVYGDSMGNDGEGFKYRGRGFIQLTGKDNYERYGDMIGVDLVNNPELAAEPEIASQIAAAYMKDREGMFDDYSDMGDVYENVYGVNPEDMRRGASRDMRMEDMAVRQGYADDFRTRIASGSYNGSFDTSSMVAGTDTTPPVQSIQPIDQSVNSIAASSLQAGDIQAASNGKTGYMVENQVENNSLAASERAAQNQATVVALSGGSNVSSNTSVNAPSVTVINDTAPDRAARDFTYVPIG